MISKNVHAANPSYGTPQHKHVPTPFQGYPFLVVYPLALVVLL
jgi:hypothetical protein